MDKLKITNRFLNKIFYQIDNLNMAIENCQKNLGLLKQHIDREKPNNIKAYLKDHSIFTREYIKNYANYVSWCKMYEVKPLKLNQFNNQINKIFSALPSSKTNIAQKAEMFEAQFSGFVSKLTDENLTENEFKDKIVEYVLTAYPNLNEDKIKIFIDYATAYINLFNATKDLREYTKQEEPKTSEVKNV